MKKPPLEQRKSPPLGRAFTLQNAIGDVRVVKLVWLGTSSEELFLHTFSTTAC